MHPNLGVLQLLERGSAHSLQLLLGLALDLLPQRFDLGAVLRRRTLDRGEPLAELALHRVALRLQQLGTLLRDDPLHLDTLGREQPLLGGELSLELRLVLRERALAAPRRPAPASGAPPR